MWKILFLRTLVVTGMNARACSANMFVETFNTREAAETAMERMDAARKQIEEHAGDFSAIRLY